MISYWHFRPQERKHTLYIFSHPVLGHAELDLTFDFNRWMFLYYLNTTAIRTDITVPKWIRQG